MPVLYAQTSSGQFVAIPGLSLTLPEGVGVATLVMPQTVQGTWYGVRGSNVIIDSPASLSAIF